MQSNKQVNVSNLIQGLSVAQHVLQKRSAVIHALDFITHTMELNSEGRLDPSLVDKTGMPYDKAEAKKSGTFILYSRLQQLKYCLKTETNEAVNLQFNALLKDISTDGGLIKKIQEESTKQVDGIYLKEISGVLKLPKELKRLLDMFNQKPTFSLDGPIREYAINLIQIFRNINDDNVSYRGAFKPLLQNESFLQLLKVEEKLKKAESELKMNSLKLKEANESLAYSEKQLASLAEGEDERVQIELDKAREERSQLSVDQFRSEIAEEKLRREYDKESYDIYKGGYIGPKIDEETVTKDIMEKHTNELQSKITDLARRVGTRTYLIKRIQELKAAIPNLQNIIDENLQIKTEESEKQKLYHKELAVNPLFQLRNRILNEFSTKTVVENPKLRTEFIEAVRKYLNEETDQNNIQMVHEHMKRAFKSTDFCYDIESDLDLRSKLMPLMPVFEEEKQNANEDIIAPLLFKDSVATVEPTKLHREYKIAKKENLATYQSFLDSMLRSDFITTQKEFKNIFEKPNKIAAETVYTSGMAAGLHKKYPWEFFSRTIIESTKSKSNEKTLIKGMGYLIDHRLKHHRSETFIDKIPNIFQTIIHNEKSKLFSKEFRTNLNKEKEKVPAAWQYKEVKVGLLEKKNQQTLNDLNKTIESLEVELAHHLMILGGPQPDATELELISERDTAMDLAKRTAENLNTFYYLKNFLIKNDRLPERGTFLAELKKLGLITTVEKGQTWEDFVSKAKEDKNDDLIKLIKMNASDLHNALEIQHIENLMAGHKKAFYQLAQQHTIPNTLIREVAVSKDYMLLFKHLNLSPARKKLISKNYHLAEQAFNDTFKLVSDDNRSTLNDFTNRFLTLLETNRKAKIDPKELTKKYEGINSYKDYWMSAETTYESYLANLPDKARQFLSSRYGELSTEKQNAKSRFSAFDTISDTLLALTEKLKRTPQCEDRYAICKELAPMLNKYLADFESAVKKKSEEDITRILGKLNAIKDLLDVISSGEKIESKEAQQRLSKHENALLARGWLQTKLNKDNQLLGLVKKINFAANSRLQAEAKALVIEQEQKSVVKEKVLDPKVQEEAKITPETVSPSAIKKKDEVMHEHEPPVVKERKTIPTSEEPVLPSPEVPKTSPTDPKKEPTLTAKTKSEEPTVMSNPNTVFNNEKESKKKKSKVTENTNNKKIIILK